MFNMYDYERECEEAAAKAWELEEELDDLREKRDLLKEVKSIINSLHEKIPKDVLVSTTQEVEAVNKCIDKLINATEDIITDKQRLADQYHDRAMDI
jgi:hypothetical protein